MGWPTMADLRSILRQYAGPPVNIEAIIRAFGLKVDKKADLDPEIAGQIERLPDGTFKISANRLDHYYRQRFTLAHELAHYLYHSHLIGDGVDDSKAYRSIPEGQFYNTQIGPTEETEANRFAAAVLMPSDLVRSVWEETPNVSQVAQKFQVSSQAMEIRLRGLGLT